MTSTTTTYTTTTRADLDKLLTMAFMRGAESVGLEAMDFAERLSTHPTFNDYEVEVGQRVMRMFAEQLAAGLAAMSRHARPEGKVTP